MTDEDEYELDLSLEEANDGLTRPLRFLPEGSWVVETTTRTIQGRFLLLPRPEGSFARCSVVRASCSQE